VLIKQYDDEDDDGRESVSRTIEASARGTTANINNSAVRGR